MNAELNNLVFVTDALAKTLSSTAKKLTDSPFSITTANVKKARGALISVEGDDIRLRYSGVPTASLGHLVKAGERIFVQGRAVLLTLQMIRVTTDATVSVTLFQ